LNLNIIANSIRINTHQAKFIARGLNPLFAVMLENTILNFYGARGTSLGKE
jgi:hypothetical protein